MTLRACLKSRQVRARNVQIGNINNISDNAVGKYRRTIIQKDEKDDIIFEDVCYCVADLVCNLFYGVPDLVCNLFSVTVAWSKGW